MIQHLSWEEGAFAVLFREQSYRNFIDAIMLFGATMELKQDYIVLRVQRHLERRRSLAWIIALLELHGIKTRVCETSDETRVVYRTAPMVFSLCEHARWYDVLGQKLPEDLEVTLPLLVVWSVKALSYSTFGKAIKFCAPRSTAKQLDSIVREAISLGFNLRLNANGLFIPAEEREVFGSQLIKYVPRAVWDAEMLVEAN